jgi:AraC-like DNA-binding protein
MTPKTLPVYEIKDFSYSPKEGDFYANTFLAHLKQHAQLILAPHKHSFYVSMVFTKGSGTHRIDFTRYPIKPGNVFTLFPGQVHDWKFSKNIDGYIFFHTKEFYNLYFLHEKVEDYPFYHSTYGSRLIVLKNKSYKKIKEIYHEMVEEYQDGKLMKYQKICSLLNVLYVELSRLYPSGLLAAKKNQSQLRNLRKLEGLIDLHYKRVKYPKDYAVMMHMSEKHLNRISKESLNKTISELITDRIVLEAKRMLMHSTETVSQIAIELGYFENPYFFRIFKKKTGKTPLEFINRSRKE